MGGGSYLGLVPALIFVLQVMRYYGGVNSITIAGEPRHYTQNENG